MSPNREQAPAAAEGQRRAAGELALVTAIVAIAAVVRFWGIDGNSVWTDELVALENSCGRGWGADTLPRDTVVTDSVAPTRLRFARPFLSIPSALAEDTHPPLHALLLRLWREALGEEAVVARSLSAVLSIVTVLLFYAALRELEGPRAALFGMALLAIAGSQVGIAQFARYYALLVALVMASALAMARIGRRGATRARWAAFATLMVLALLADYQAAPPLAAIVLFGMLRLPGRDRVALAFAAGGVIAVWVILWGPFLVAQLSGAAGQVGWLVDRHADHVSRTFLRAGLLPAKYLAPAIAGGAWLAVVAALAYVVPPFVWRNRHGLQLFWLLLVSVVGAVLAADLARHSWMLDLLRFTAVASVAACGVIALLLLGNGRGWRCAASAALVIATLAAIGPAYEVDRLDYRGLGTHLAPRMDRTDALVILEPSYAPWTADILYLAATHFARELPGRVAVLSHPAAPSLVGKLRQARALFVINVGERRTEEMLPGSRVLETRDFPRLAAVERVSLGL